MQTGAARLVFRDITALFAVIAAELGRSAASKQTAARKSNTMPRYLISFDDGSMDHIPEADLPAVSEAAHAVLREAKAAGIWIFGGGIQRQRSSIVGTDGSVTDGPDSETKAVVGGFSIIEVSSRKEAVAWAARIAKACQCAQEVREIMFDPES